MPVFDNMSSQSYHQTLHACCHYRQALALLVLPFHDVNQAPYAALPHACY